MNSLLEEREENTRRRKKAKDYFDSIITLSNESGKKNVVLRAKSKELIKDRPKRFLLLDEGSVIRGDDEVDFYIQKGTLEKYMDVLPDDFVGTINLGHLPFATFPFILGEWTKENLHLEDAGGGRKTLYIDNTIDYDSVFVKELLKMPYSIGVSGEFYVWLNEEATQALGFEVVDDLFIYAYGLVGDAGNVNSQNITLSKKGGTDVTLQEIQKQLENKPVDYSEINEKLDKLLNAVDAVEPAEGVAEEVDVEPEVEPEAEPEVEPEQETEPEVEPEAEPEAEDAEESDPMQEALANVLSRMEAMNKRISDLEGENASLKTKLSAMTKKESARVTQFKQLFDNLSDEKEEPVNKFNAVSKTDGIGEI